MNPSAPDQGRAAGLAALDSFLDSHPEAEQRVREILDKHLGKPGFTSYRDAFASLLNYVDNLDLIGIMDYVAQTDQATRLQDVGQYASPQAMSFLRGIISVYGPELARAYLILDERPNDWNLFNREVYYDQVNEVYYIVVRLAKNNGEEAVIEGNANSMLDLATNMVRTLLHITVRDSFKPEYVEPFTKETKKFLAFLRPPARKPKNSAKK